MSSDASPSGTTYWLTAAAGQVCREALVTLNAPTDVSAGSRFESRTAEVFVTRVNGRSPDSEVLHFRCDAPILRVHAALAGGSRYAQVDGTVIGPDQLAVWQFTRGAGVRRVTVRFGPATDGGATMTVRCDAGSLSPPTTAR